MDFVVAGENEDEVSSANILEEDYGFQEEIEEITSNVGVTKFPISLKIGLPESEVDKNKHRYIYIYIYIYNQ